MRIALALLLAACADPAEPNDPTDDPQLPPRGDAAIQDWLTAGYYKSWRCQPTTHEAMDPSPHPTARICSNAAIFQVDESYPAGASTVKELYENGVLHGFAVSRRLTAAPGPGSWYWYEANPEQVYADGVAVPTCINCHENAPRDFVWTTAP